MARNAFYITTPIYYPSDRLHIGHAYTTVAADALARFKRLQGYDVLFLTGTDEHGQKMARRARAAGKEPIDFVTEVVTTIKELWRRLDISHDDFIRTTEPRHARVVQAVFRKIYEQGDIYKDFYEGWYCTECEAFLLERQLADGLCPDCGRKVEWLKEESYFFRLSKYQDRLLKHIEEHPEFIQPLSRRHEMINFIQSGLEDLSVSRTTFDWGIPVPGAAGHVVYVWFDALTNYITGAGYLQDEEKFARYWPADVHLVGKEIVRFHTVIWPIILMALGLELPRCVFGHGWLVLEGGKISKSKGNVVDPLVLIDRYGVDAVRYYLLREMPFGADSYYTEDALVQRINSDLANDYGNLLHRTLAMVDRYFGGVMPAASGGESIDEELRAAAAQAPGEMADCMDRMELSNALGAVWKLVAKANKYADETSPWALAHQPGKRARLGTVLYNLGEATRIASVLLSPFLPRTFVEVCGQLGIAEQRDIQTWESAHAWGKLRAGTPVRKGRVIFPRVEKKDEHQEEVGMISIEEFRQVDLRVAEVLGASKVKGADKLLRLEVSLGREKRQVIAGIAEHYLPEQLVGKRIIVVANLKPTKIRGLESAGMLLAAVEGNRLVLATVDGEIPAGTALS